ncbi:MAG: ABC transporter permease [Armatimonadota bacterium]|nr:ABC transporter permease [Armatimonadota bacterium]MDR7485090.1 ABC transporter permease [Armatimonadota bacterium]MDR7533478.1 ABC transporter permease [Armatimonadota bacterium]MDR7537021.1 ABC transporter permease [Armatimonadota bacterium]
MSARALAARLAGFLLLLWFVATVTFLLMFAVPQDPGAAIAGPQATPEVTENLRRLLGLDRPLHVQYGRYVWRLLHGDLGRSYVFGRPVGELLRIHLWPSVQLALACIVAEAALGLPVGIISATRPGSRFDRIAMVTTLVTLGLPHFWIGLFLLYLVGARLGWLPLGGYGGVRHLVLPALAVGIAYAGWYARVIRSTLLDVLGRDFVRTARSKGLSERVVITRHALRNALIPVVTMWGLDFANFVGGLVVIEAVFGWPGLGAQMVEAVLRFDVPLAMGTVLVGAAVVGAVNLLLDLIYPVLDPRLRAHG